MSRSLALVDDDDSRMARRRSRLLSTPAASLAGVVERVRIALGLTQETMAKRLGVPRDRVHDWERGKALPAATMLEPIALLSTDTSAAVSLQTLVWMWWREQAVNEEAAKRKAKRAARKPGRRAA